MYDMRRDWKLVYHARLVERDTTYYVFANREGLPIVRSIRADSEEEAWSKLGLPVVEVRE